MVIMKCCGVMENALPRGRISQRTESQDPLSPLPIPEGERPATLLTILDSAPPPGKEGVTKSGGAEREESKSYHLQDHTIVDEQADAYKKIVAKINNEAGDATPGVTGSTSLSSFTSGGKGAITAQAVWMQKKAIFMKKLLLSASLKKPKLRSLGFKKKNAGDQDGSSEDSSQRVLFIGAASKPVEMAPYYASELESIYESALELALDDDMPMLRSTTVTEGLDYDVAPGHPRPQNLTLSLIPHATSSCVVATSSNLSMNNNHQPGGAPTGLPLSSSGCQLLAPTEMGKVCSTPCGDFLKNLRFQNFAASRFHAAQIDREINPVLDKDNHKAALKDFIESVAHGELREVIMRKLVARMGIDDEPPCDADVDPFTFAAWASATNGITSTKSASTAANMINKTGDTSTAAAKTSSTKTSSQQQQQLRTRRSSSFLVARQLAKSLLRRRSRRGSNSSNASSASILQSSKAAAETVDRMIVHFFCELNNGPDWICFSLLRYCLFDKAKTLQHMARIIVWLNCDIYNTLLFEKDHIPGHALLPSHLMSFGDPHPMPYMLCDKEIGRAAVTSGASSRVPATVTVSAGTQTLGPGLPAASFGEANWRGYCPQGGGPMDDVDGVSDLQVESQSSSAGNNSTPTYNTSKNKEEYKINLEFDFEESPAQNLRDTVEGENAGVGADKNAGVGGSDCVVERPTVSTQTTASYPAVYPIVRSGETPEALAKVLSPIPEHISAFNMKTWWDELNGHRDMNRCTGPAFRFSSKIFQSKNMETIEISRFAPVLGLFTGKGGGPMLNGITDEQLQASITVMKLRKIQHMKEFGCTGCIFLLDCKGTSLFSMSKAVRNAQKYQSIVWEFMRNMPGGMVKSLLYNMSAGAITCLTMATMMWCADDRARIKTCTGRPTKKQLDDLGITEAMFQEMEKEIESGGHLAARGIKKAGRKTI